jgi:hypothetical protein
MEEKCDVHNKKFPYEIAEYRKLNMIVLFVRCVVHKTFAR